MAKENIPKIPKKELDKLEIQDIEEAIKRFNEKTYLNAGNSKFSSSRDYFLSFEGKEYWSKPIMAIAYEVHYGKTITVKELTGGIGSSGVVTILKKILKDDDRFKIVEKQKKEKCFLPDEEDLIYEKQVNEINNCNFPSQYIPEPEEIPPKIENAKKGYMRDPKKGKYAIFRAGFSCEIDSEHGSFIRKTDGEKYMEPHHIIPFSKQDEFTVSLDVPANIVSLCSNCHNEIHYGVNGLQIILGIFKKRKKELVKAGIKVTEKQLKGYYGGNE